MTEFHETITSRSNPQIKYAFSLQNRKDREEAQAFITEGEKLFFEAATSFLPITHVFLREDRKEQLLPKIRTALSDTRYTGTTVYTVSESVFEKISTENAPQGILSVIKYLDIFKKCTIIKKIDIDSIGRAVFLSSLRDPGNLGAVIRSAAGFGADTVILSADCADVYHPRTIRAAMGTLFRMRIFEVMDAVASVSVLQECGRRVFAAELRERAVSLDEIDLRKTDVFVIGNEGHGLDPALSSSCTGSVFIPIAPGVESLNAAVAAAVFLREQNRIAE